MNERINLWSKEQAPLFDENAEQLLPNITPYIAKNSKSCVVVCPGGGYVIKSDYEGEGYAKWLMENGVSAFVLDYRVEPYKYPAPQYDALRALRYARYYAEKYGYDKNKIGIMGSSAGAHLAGSIAVASDEMGYKHVDEIDSVSFRPDFAVLCYPVVSMTKFAHVGSRIALMGEVSDETAEQLSLNKRITENTPPMFIWHTAEDGAVPVENSLMLAGALSANKIPFELHVFQKGAHGLGLAESTEGTNAWGRLLLKWFDINNLRWSF